MSEIRVVVGPDEFKKLVNGEEVFFPEENVRMIFSDIGFHYMRDYIGQAEDRVISEQKE